MGEKGALPGKDFTYPEPAVSHRETVRRLEVLDDVIPKFRSVSSAIVLFGSMAYGRYFSVTPTSDIDLVIVIDIDQAGSIHQTGLFDAAQTRHYVEGYRQDAGKQFSLTTAHDGINVECHFWDREAYLSALALEQETTPRLRSSQSPSVNYAYSFTGEEVTQDLEREALLSWIVSPFPTYLTDQKMFFPCRPLTNVLATPEILHGAEIMQPSIDNLWNLIAHKLVESCSGVVDLAKANVLNALPGKVKVSPDARDAILSRTKRALNEILPVTKQQ